MKRWLCLLLLLSLTACRPEAEAGEPIVVTGIGIAQSSDRYRVSVQAVEPLRTAGSLSEQSDVATAVYTAEGQSVAEALDGFLNEAGKRAYILQNQLIAIEGAQCRDRSLFDTLDYFIRNQEGRALVDLAVCRGDPSSLLDMTGGSDAVPAEYVSQLLHEGNLASRCVRTRLLDVERAMSGMYDAALPILRITDGVPQTDGTALFRDGVWVGELTERETQGLLLAGGETERCTYTEDGVTLTIDNLRASWEITPSSAGWRYRVTIRGDSRVAEEQAAYDTTRLRKAETALAAEVEAALRRTCVEQKSDPLGLARRAASRYSRHGVTQEEVRAALPQAVFSATVILSHTDRGFLTE